MNKWISSAHATLNIHHRDIGLQYIIMVYDGDIPIKLHPYEVLFGNKKARFLILHECVHNDEASFLFISHDKRPTLMSSRRELVMPFAAHGQAGKNKASMEHGQLPNKDFVSRSSSRSICLVAGGDASGKPALEEDASWPS